MLRRSDLLIGGRGWRHVKIMGIGANQCFDVRLGLVSVHYGLPRAPVSVDTSMYAMPQKVSVIPKMKLFRGGGEFFISVSRHDK